MMKGGAEEDEGEVEGMGKNSEVCSMENRHLFPAL